ncbi:hypothetical protein [Neptunicella marina]|uniref:Uncharacterized protein n=1 Tax=Neptunicella marina TaxID=2125989 RepID=A0A8J6ITW1_9ALTE|nr:hypothetical protein [Neptunicella marina]MBC3766159.1 hypothetical protein [Neptunicella marina]
MKPKTKALLFSALLFPGTGHFVLKRPLAGSGIVFAALLLIHQLASDVMTQAQLIADDIMAGRVAPTIEGITIAMESQPVDPLMPLWSALLLVVWIGAMLDVLRISRLKPVSVKKAANRSS